MTEELEKEVEEYLHNNYCCKGSYCGFNTECKEGVRIRCSEFDILKKHLINFGESRKERIVELEKELADAKKVQVVEHFEAYGQCRDSRRIADLEAQIEKMKSDVMGNIKWADQNKNNQMYCKLNVMFNQWEIKEKK